MQRKNELTPENRLTNALVQALHGPSSQRVVQRFAHEVCGLSKLGTLIEPPEAQLHDFRDLNAPQGLIVGIAPQPGTVLGNKRISGKSQPDALIHGDEVAVLIENKIRGKCSRSQLIQHAMFWALDANRSQPMWSLSDPPEGYRIATWGDVRRWLSQERNYAEADSGRLGHLERLLNEYVPHSASTDWRAAEPVPVIRRPDPVSLRTITERWDLEQLRKATAAYVSRNPVYRDDCKADTERMAEAFATAGKPVPLGLQWFDPTETMTPLRRLTIMYKTHEDRPDNWQRAWTGWWNGIVGRGADQAVLAAMLAWALTRGGDAKANNYTRANVPVVWQLAPESSPGLEDFHAAVEVAQR